mgnify:CR=1 FL=1
MRSRIEAVSGSGVRARIVGIGLIGWMFGVIPVLAPDEALAGIYRYIDDEGVLHFADSRRDPRYRRMKIVHQDGPVISPRPSVRVPDERDYDRLIVKIATRHRVEPALVKAVISPASLAGEYRLSFGMATGFEYVTQIFMDQVVHSWDVMKGSGQSMAFDDALVTAAIPVAHEMVAFAGQGSVFGYSQEVVPDESQLDLLLGVVGRKGDWAPPAGGIAR